MKSAAVVTEVKPKAAHFRIVMPEGFRGRRHSAYAARVYIALAGLAEVEFPSLVDVVGHWGIDDPTELTLRVMGSIEVEYP